VRYKSDHLEQKQNRETKGDIYMADEQVEQEAQALFKQWQTQQNAMMGGGANLSGDMSMGTDQSPHLMEGENEPDSPDQSPVNPINSVRPMGAPISKPPPMDPKLTTGSGANMGNLTQAASVPGGSPTPAQMPGVCKDCGTMHPPVPEGQKCPNAGVEATPDNPNALDDMTLNKHLVDMKNILLTQIGAKDIKNQNKFLQFAIIEFTKSLEGYSE